MKTIAITITLDELEPSEHIIELPENFTIADVRTAINTMAIHISRDLTPHVTREP